MNDIASRIAAGVTGRDGAIVTHLAYHGVTAAIAELSLEEWPGGFAMERVECIPVDSGDEEVAAAAGQLAAAGHPLARRAGGERLPRRGRGHASGDRR